MRKPVVVAFLGRAGAGKTTAGQALVGLGAKRAAFADPLKRLAKHIMRFSDDQLYGDFSKKEAPDPRYRDLSPRVFMQRLGDGARQHLHREVWVKALINTIRADFETTGQSLFVVDDCRYRNEAEAIVFDPWIDGRVVKLVCDEVESSADASHPSEAEVDTVPDEWIDYTIRWSRASGDRVVPELVESFAKAAGVV